MRYLLLFIHMFIAVLSWAQSKQKFYVSASLNPIATLCYVHSSSTKPVPYTFNTQTYERFVDSSQSSYTHKLSIGASIFGNFSIGKKWTLQTGLGFSEYGFVREQLNVKIFDRLYPGMGNGQVNDMSDNGSPRNAFYYYRFQYLSIPVLFNYTFKRSSDYKWTYHFSGGLAANVLLNHQINIKLENFFVDGKSKYKFDSTGFNATPFALNVFIGGRVDYRIDKRLSLFAQPLITYFPLSIANADMKVNPYGIQLQLGLHYAIEKKDD